MAPSHPSGTAQRVAASVAECSKLGIPVLPPDINRSDVTFTVEDLDDGATGIRFGLSIIKNCGESAVRSIIEARRDQPGERFASFESFCDSVDWSSVNKRVVEALIKCGAMDGLGERAALLTVLEQAISAAQSRQKAARRGQTDLFASMGDAAPAVELSIPEVDPIAESILLQWEKEHLGLYLSSHPLRGFTDMIRDGGFIQVAEISEDAVGEQIEIIGLVNSVRKLNTKSNRTMAIVEFEDLTGSIEMVFFPDTYDSAYELLEVDAAIRVKAKIDKRNDTLQLIAESAHPVTSEPPKPVEPVRFNEVRVTLPVSEDISTDVELMRRIRTVLDEFPGEDRLVLALPMNGHSVQLAAGMNIDWCGDVETLLEELVGQGHVEVDEKVEFPQPDQRSALAV
jgi:DNA polymerase III subunit alpha